MTEPTEVKKPFIIDLDQDYRIKIESLGDFESSFFNEIYERAARDTNRIIQEHNAQRKKDLPNDFYKSSIYNNLIAFVGDRGTGKSSAMTSFCKALIEKEKSESLFINDFHDLSKTNFIGLPPVDPSLFHDKDNLFEIIISQLFNNFQQKLKVDTNETDYEQKGTLLRQFQKVYDNIRTVNRQDQHYGEEAIDALSSLAFGTNLSDSFKKLIEKYIAFFGKTNEDYLIIAIDDFDLNVKGAYQMLEDVRKYFITFNIILFVACKIDQLVNSLEEKIHEGIPLILKAKDAQVHELPKITAENYLEKLIPADRRLYLPELQTYVKTNDQDIEILENGKKELIEQKSLEDVVLNTIYRQTGLYISTPLYDLHPIIPTRFRTLINMMTLYRHLNKDETSLIKLNKQWLEDDAFQLKLYNLSESSQSYEDIVRSYNRDFDFIAQFESYVSTNLNQRIIQYLKVNRYFPENRIRSTLLSSLLLIANQNNTAFNISIGDLIFVLDVVQSRIESNNKHDLNFIKAIKMFYNSYLLRMLYAGKDTSGLVGGSILAPEGGDYLPSGRDIFKFSYDVITNSLKSGYINEEDLLWVFTFVKRLGNNSDYLEKDNAYYEIGDGDYSFDTLRYAHFSFLDFIINSIFIERTSQKVKNLVPDVEQIQLYRDIQQWNRNNIEFIALFHNVDFLQEFIRKVSHYSKRFKKELEGDYSSILSGYLLGRPLNRAFEETIEQVDLKGHNSIIKNDLFSNHPIIEYWQNTDNQLRVNRLLDSIWKQNGDKKDETENLEQKPQISTKEIKTLAKEVLDWTNWILREKKHEGNHRGVKGSVTFRVNKFKELDKKIFDDLKRYRWHMDRNVEEGLILIKDYLEEIIENG